MEYIDGVNKNTYEMLLINSNNNEYDKKIDDIQLDVEGSTLSFFYKQKLKKILV